ncbi:hypothetical protein [Cupriavidus basilensis]|uniref:hypothetical protein n=1 Tax=Cupriavidus basilensis TaxID=68895 RepID=UPI000A6AB9DA|nr:hypothetical protein [Cupriavidus basilensis]
MSTQRWEVCSNLVRTVREADGSGGWLIAEIPPNMPDTHDHARLIAAAPELFDALHAARQWLNGDKWRYDEDPIRRQCWQDHVDAMDAALAKVTGAAA